MKLRNFSLVFTLLLAYCVTLTHSIQCYICNDESSCQHPSLSTCTPSYATRTNIYLNLHHLNVNMNATSSKFYCLHEYHNSSHYGKIFYKGCIYSTVNACSLKMIYQNQTGQYQRDCYQCNDRDGCNPAGRLELHFVLPFLAIIVAVFGKFVSSS